MTTESNTSTSNENAGGTSAARIATYAFWCVVAVIATYVVSLLVLSSYGVHVIKGI